MSSDLLAIARSGAHAARVALDVTAQNIANAATSGYVRRSVALSEVTSAGAYGRTGETARSGVRIDHVIRNADQFRQGEVRRTSSDSARAGTELAALENVEAAVEQSRLYPAAVEFEAALQRLAGDPVNPSLRTAALEAARTLAATFNQAASSLDAAGTFQRFEAQDETAQVGVLARELALLNNRMARAGGADDQPALLDQRDNLLQRLAQFSDVSTVIAADQTVTVRLGGSAGAILVSGNAVSPFALQTGPGGTIGFTVGGAPVALSGGSLTGRAQALNTLAVTRSALDTLANGMIAAANGAQASGTALDGSAGQAMFGGSGAAGIALVLGSGAGIATAPAGAAAGSRDPAGLTALRSALAGADVAGGTDALLFTLSSTVAARRTTHEALDVIGGAARVALEAQSGVDLDTEAVNLIRYQQAFQASGKAMQVAATLFDTLYAIR